MARVHANYARLLRAKKDYAGADRALRESIAIAVRRLGPEHAATAGYELDLGQVLVLEGRLAEAEPLLKRGLAAAEAASDARNTRQALEQLIKVYELSGRPAEAKACVLQLAALSTGDP